MVYICQVSPGLLHVDIDLNRNKIKQNKNYLRKKKNCAKTCHISDGIGLFSAQQVLTTIRYCVIFVRFIGQPLSYPLCSGQYSDCIEENFMTNTLQPIKNIQYIYMCASMSSETRYWKEFSATVMRRDWHTWNATKRKHLAHLKSV